MQRKIEQNIYEGLLQNIVSIIEQSKTRLAVTVNQGITVLYWNIGKLIGQILLKNKRAEYGEKIIATLSRKLTDRYGKGYTKYALSRMIAFYKAFPNEKIVATLSQQLSWSHFIEFILIEDPLKRQFYIELTLKRNGAFVTFVKE